MVEIKTNGEIDAMREAGRVVARALAAARSLAAPGVRLSELDDAAHTVIRESGATPAFLGYRPHFAPTPFPGVICASVNHVIVHGIPGKQRLREGDLLGIDCGAHLDGWTGDSAITITVGSAPGSPTDTAVIAAAEDALRAATKAMVPGGRLGDIGHAVQRTAAAGGYEMLEDFGGHGIGRRMHEDPNVPNRGRPGRGMTLRHGLVLAIEPMFIAGGDGRQYTASDGWSLCAAPGARAVHVEHTVAVTDDGPRVLTLP
ncbi:type I methionyl aminopeptidase [Spongiactinospora sp. TRM90649]|uniref:type I methionyl aminopeptidase n=1 Tax=Spongiactinospora sp. TRM90649 TaxID=3031114 RepID=UPI0023F83378|nr:type I methionyl aminopeptidase [Spongiactinospora sp. TRM90649]MDF5756704.1 type I methionyl aminopeptidase [Spongiactinospora sp. TRM90649]